MDKTITILLVGETGVGKSTFINAFVNYLLFDSMEDAAMDMKCLIPTQFTVFDKKDRKLKEVHFGQPDPQNEDTDSTKSGTKNCRCYTFKLDDITLRIIDTPGVVDTNGLIKDNKNMRNLLSFISQYKEINAICVLLKPNNAKLSVVFKYCIFQILTHLNKSASENIIFIFTNARGTFYQPGDTAPALMKILDAIKFGQTNVEIKFDENTTYCLDNEAFRYLVAVSEPNNIELDEKFNKDFEESWMRSVAECQRMLSYIRSLKPHLVEDTITINNIREKIILLQKPIGDIGKNISDEITECEKRRIKIGEYRGDIRGLQKELYIPTLDIVSTSLEKPITVCTDPKCREEKVINGDKKYHFKSICHNPCYLSHSDSNIIGNSGLLDCQAFNKYEDYGSSYWSDGQNFVPDVNFTLNEHGKVKARKTKRTESEICFKCGHSFRTHLHITYDTKIVRKEIRDEVKFERITTKEGSVKTQQKMITKIQERIGELRTESKIIADISAEFACFLKKNALTPFNDSLEDYIKYLIDNQNSEIFIEGETNENVGTLQQMLEQYQRTKQIIMNAIIEEGRDYDRISSEKINQKFTELFNLKNYGKVIQDHYNMQKESVASIHCYLNEKEINVNPGMGSTFVKKLKKIVQTFYS